MRERRFQFFPNKLLQVDIPGPLCAPVTIHKRKVKLPAAAPAASRSQHVVLLGYCVSSLQKQKLVCRVLGAGAESDTGTRPWL